MQDARKWVGGVAIAADGLFSALVNPSKRLQPWVAGPGCCANFHGLAHLADELQESLARLGLEYGDLYLVHLTIMKFSLHWIAGSR